jgi:hypothetical protein
MTNDLNTVLDHLTDEQLLDAFESKTAGYSPDAREAMKKLLLERGFHPEHIGRIEQDAITADKPSTPTKLDGLGGWLIFWGFNLLLIGMVSLYGGYVDISTYPVLGGLTMLYGLIFLNSFVMYYKRHWFFPRLMIIGLSLGCVLSLWGAIVGELADPEVLSPLVGAAMFTIMYNMLWIAYFVRSRRVKATFLS